MSIFENFKEIPGESDRIPSNLNRRNFGKLVVAGAIGGKALLSSSVSEAREYVPGQKPNPSNVNIALQASSNPDEEELTWIKQLGVKYVVVWTGGKGATYENFLKIRKTYENAGINVWSIGNSSVHCNNMAPVALNLSNRDDKIKEYTTYLRNLGRAGVHYTTYGHLANGIWGTERGTTRGGAIPARSLDLVAAERGEATYGNTRYKDINTPTNGRAYSEEEMWDNFTHFIKIAAPVAEEAGVNISFHPADPPMHVLGGIPRIFSSFDGFKRAMEIVDSPNVGLCLCVGCWLEGGDLLGKDVVETIHYFGKRNKLFKIHFRNVDQPLPHYIETFLDDGYYDMYKVMKAIVEVNNTCTVIDDHRPRMVGGTRMAQAFHTGYMRALMERANEELAG
ncbi:mannonate dehydratase [Candidatus Latescibacterota bacterium]